MSTQAMSFSRVSPESNPGARSWRQRLLRRSSFRHHTQSRAAARSHSQSAYRRAFFRTGELGGAEGIDGAEI
jgi:hypothetical protein